MATIEEPSLSEEQFHRLAEYGDREQVEVGDVLYTTGDRHYDLFEKLGHIRYSATELDARDCASQPVTLTGVVTRGTGVVDQETRKPRRLLLHRRQCRRVRAPAPRGGPRFR